MAVDPMEPFATASVLEEVLVRVAAFDFKLYGPVPRRLYRGAPTKYEFDLDLGLIHFTEQDFEGLSALFREFNQKWGTQMTFCVYPSREADRHMVLNVRGSPLAPSEID